MAQPSINGIECIECGEIEVAEEYEAAHPSDSPPECSNCGQSATNWVLVTPCDKGAACRSDDHHFGINAHVRDV